MVLPFPAKNGTRHPLFGICLNSDILTFFCCIGQHNFVRGRPFFIMHPALQRSDGEQEKKRKKKYTFVWW